jgi:recombinational DNA repair ATPase RecF
MKLHSIKLRNIFNLDNLDLTFQPFSILVGPNGSGKTNIVRVINFVLGIIEKWKNNNLDNFQPELNKMIKYHDKEVIIQISFQLDETVNNEIQKIRNEYIDKCIFNNNIITDITMESLMNTVNNENNTYCFAK